MSRPEKEIDWNLVDSLLIAGCHGTEIAPHFDMHYSTFYDRVVKKYGISFTDYAQEKRQKGNSNLRYHQYLKALGKTEAGDNSLLIWLGKNRLGQKDREEDKGLSPNDTGITELLNSLKSLTNITNAIKPETDSELPGSD